MNNDVFQRVQVELAKLEADPCARALRVRIRQPRVGFRLT